MYADTFNKKSFPVLWVSTGLAFHFKPKTKTISVSRSIDSTTDSPRTSYPVPLIKFDRHDEYASAGMRGPCGEARPAVPIDLRQAQNVVATTGESQQLHRPSFHILSRMNASCDPEFPEHDALQAPRRFRLAAEPDSAPTPSGAGDDDDELLIEQQIVRRRGSSSPKGFSAAAAASAAASRRRRDAPATLGGPLASQIAGETPLTAEQQAETSAVAFLAMLFVAILAMGVFLAASGFLSEELDQFAQDVVYPAFSPTIGLFLAGSTVYGVWKTGGLQRGGDAK
jgi:hypothetical protein